MTYCGEPVVSLRNFFLFLFLFTAFGSVARAQSTCVFLSPSGQSAGTPVWDLNNICPSKVFMHACFPRGGCDDGAIAVGQHAKIFDTAKTNVRPIVEVCWYDDWQKNTCRFR